jgi:hypothetical protein
MVRKGKNYFDSQIMTIVIFSLSFRLYFCPQTNDILFVGFFNNESRILNITH